MPAFSLLAKLDRIVTQEIKLLIEAPSQEEAEKIAREVLDVYPAPLPGTNPMVHRVVVQKVQYWIPKSVDFVAVKEEKA
jgi:hypothetical protein